MCSYQTSVVLDVSLQRPRRDYEFDRALAQLCFGPEVATQDKLRLFQYVRSKEWLNLDKATTMLFFHMRNEPADEAMSVAEVCILRAWSYDMRLFQVIAREFHILIPACWSHIANVDSILSRQSG